MFEVSITYLVFVVLASLIRWELGIYLAVLTAFLQDPLRKLTPDQPVVFIVFAAVVFGAAFVGAAANRVVLNPSHIIGWRRFVQTPFVLYVALVLIQAVHSYVRLGNPLISMLGLANYLTPFAALSLAYMFVTFGGIRRIRRFLHFYLACAIPALSTIYLQTAGFDWQILGEVGTGITLFDAYGLMEANSGTFRASEIAAWHAAISACLVILLFSEAKITLPRLVIITLAVGVILGVGILTGRRKLLVMVAVFICLYWGLLAVYLRGWRTPAIGLAVLGFIVYLVGNLSLETSPSELLDRSDEYQRYVTRSENVFADVPKRVIELGIAPVTWAYNAFGFFGGGLGIGTQGVQYLTKVGHGMGAAEGGLGKFTLELGVPGLLAVFWLGIALFRHVRSILKHLSQHSAVLTRMACGLVAILVANAASFSVATQTYGDLFVLLFMGILIGALFAMPALLPSRRGAVRNLRGFRLYTVRP